MVSLAIYSSFVTGWDNQWDTAVDRMESILQNTDLHYQIQFLEYEFKSPGFATTGKKRGLQLASGLSHGMLRVFLQMHVHLLKMKTIRKRVWQISHQLIVLRKLFTIHILMM